MIKISKQNTTTNKLITEKEEFMVKDFHFRAGNNYKELR
jgi:hypothetical protein